MNLYAVLGLDQDASDEEIRRAYRQAVLRWHPDRNPDPDAASTFHAVQEAYERLRDPALRSSYGVESEPHAVRKVRFDDGDRPHWVPPDDQREPLQFVAGRGWTSLEEEPPKPGPPAGPAGHEETTKRRRWTRDERVGLAVAALAAVGGGVAIALAPLFS